LLNGVSIEHNDFIVVDRSKRTPRDREIVVANDGDVVNVKRIVFDYDHGQVALISESTEHHDPIYLCAEDNIDAFIEGTVVQVLKVRN
jgi:phage repressor protein C with HTH and peptisase S24 domain